MSAPMPPAATMSIELAGHSFSVLGRGAASDAIASGLTANGAAPAAQAEIADLLIVVHELLPGDRASPSLELGRKAAAMVQRGTGRIVVVLSAVAALPMRRHPGYSIAMAAALAEVRSLAMRCAPQVLVNAVGAGAIEADDHLLAGDREMLGHVALERAGGLDDIVNAVLFLCDPLNSYTTGQILNVDGGWTVGYGRNF